MKSRQQREFERSLKRGRGLAHPAAPVASDAGWQARCERPSCTVTFLTPSRQRRYCSDRCRRLVESARAEKKNRVEALILIDCAGPYCKERFKPHHATHRFCSPVCRVRSYRVDSDLSSSRCETCKKLLPVNKSRRRRFCDATCRKRASRVTPQTDTPSASLNDTHPIAPRPKLPRG